jgi:ankyrin repeat protein
MSYREKYLKYKKKYLLLKETLEGGNFIIDGITKRFTPTDKQLFNLVNKDDTTVDDNSNFNRLLNNYIEEYKQKNKIPNAKESLILARLKDENGDTLLHIASSRGKLEIVETILDYCEITLSERYDSKNIIETSTLNCTEALNKLNNTPLYNAVFYGQFKIMELLVKRGAEINGHIIKLINDRIKSEGADATDATYLRVFLNKHNK